MIWLAIVMLIINVMNLLFAMNSNDDLDNPFIWAIIGATSSISGWLWLDNPKFDLFWLIVHLIVFNLISALLAAGICLVVYIFRRHWH